MFVAVAQSTGLADVSGNATAIAAAHAESSGAAAVSGESNTVIAATAVSEGVSECLAVGEAIIVPRGIGHRTRIHRRARYDDSAHIAHQRHIKRQNDMIIKLVTTIVTSGMLDS